MAMTLRNHVDFVNAGGEGPPFELRGVGSQAHSPADRVDAEQIAELINHRIRRVRIKLRAIRLPQSANILSEFDDRALHSQANAEVGNLLLARELDSTNHSGNTPLAEAARNQDSVELTEPGGFAAFFQAFRFDPIDLRPEIMHEPPVDQCFAQALIRILELDVFADHANRYFVNRVVHAVDKRFPIPHPALGRGQMEQAHDLVIETFKRIYQRDFVNAGDIFDSDDGAFRHVAEERNFRFHFW